MSSVTGSPTSASSSSRTRVTPARAFLNRAAPHDEAHRRARRCRSDGSAGRPRAAATAAAHWAHRASSPHAAQASSWARPVRLSTQRTRRSERTQPHERLGEEPRPARVLVAAVDHLDRRPAGPVPGAIGGQQVAPGQRLERGARAGEHARHPGPPRPLDGDVAGVPRRAPAPAGAPRRARRAPRRRPGRRPAPTPRPGCRRRWRRRRRAPSQRGWPATATPGPPQPRGDRGRHRRRRAEHERVARATPRPRPRARGSWPGGSRSTERGPANAVARSS